MKKGTNTLAVYCIAGYEKDKKTDEYHPIGQVDITIEGLKKSDLMVEGLLGLTKLPIPSTVYY